MKSRKSRSRKRSDVGNKISILRREGVPQDQAVAEAMSMKRAGRLTKRGGYIRAGRKRSRGRSRSSRESQ